MRFSEDAVACEFSGAVAKCEFSPDYKRLREFGSGGEMRVFARLQVGCESSGAVAKCESSPDYKRAARVRENIFVIDLPLTIFHERILI
jgi:hypothetical protein